MTPPPNETSAREKCIYQNWSLPTKNKTMSKEKLFYYYVHTLNIHSMSDSICLYQSVSLSASSISALIFFTILKFPSSSLPYRNISSSVWSIALDIKHFLKPSTVISGKIRCHAVMITKYYYIDILGSRSYLNPWRRFTILSTDGFKNFQYMCFEFVLRVRSDQSEFIAVLMICNFWIGPCFIFESCS